MKLGRGNEQQQKRRKKMFRKKIPHGKIGRWRKKKKVGPWIIGTNKKKKKKKRKEAAATDMLHHLELYTTTATTKEARNYTREVSGAFSGEWGGYALRSRNLKIVRQHAKHNEEAKKKKKVVFNTNVHQEDRVIFFFLFRHTCHQKKKKKKVCSLIFLSFFCGHGSISTEEGQEGEE